LLLVTEVCVESPGNVTFSARAFIPMLKVNTSASNTALSFLNLLISISSLIYLLYFDGGFSVIGK